MGNKTEKRRAITAAYKERRQLGGVYRIVNTKNGRYMLLSAANLQGAKNRFAFSKNTNFCQMLKMKADWDAYGAEAFELEVLEELKMGKEQTDQEFTEDLKVLQQMWEDRLDAEKAY